MNNKLYGRVSFLDKDVSRLVLGNDNQSNIESARIMWDDYFERGGNAFDNSVIYGGGNPEKLLGQWSTERGVRDKCVFIVKGAHTPDCNPQKLTEQLHISLDRLQTDHADIYMMHRDNPEIPAAEFINELNGPRRMEVVWDGVRKLGYPASTVEKIMGANVRRIYQEVIG